MASNTELPFDLERLPPAPVVWAGAVLALFTILHVVLLTPLTSSLDDIKYLTMWVGGGICLLIYTLLVATRLVELPPRPLLYAYMGYILVLVLSTWLGAARYARWIGWQQVWTHISLAGYFLLAFGVSQTLRMVRFGIRFWVVINLIVCVVGMIHYVGGMEYVLNMLQPPDEENWKPSNFYLLVYTFARTREMISTVLNSQFFGNFLAITLPVSFATLAVNRQSLSEKLDLRQPIFGAIVLIGLAGLSSILAALCMYFTFSKASFATLVLQPALFSWLVTRYTSYRLFRIPAWKTAAVCMSIILATAVYLSMGDMSKQVRSVDTSVKSRQIIFEGAWKMFLDQPLLGCGPGSFRTEFPRFRSPDYHLHGVSNVTLSAHNRFLDLLAENGMIGFVVYIAMLLFLFEKAFAAVRHSESPLMRVVVIGYAVGVLGLYLGNMATPMMRWPIGAVVTDVVLGMFAGAAHVALNGNRVQWIIKAQAPKRHQQFGSAAAILAAAFLFFIYPYSQAFWKASKENNLGLQVTPPDDIPTGLPRRAMEHVIEEYLEASKHFEKAIELNPTFITTYYKLAAGLNRVAGYYEELGEIEKMRKYQKRAMDVYYEMQKYSPDYSEVHYNLAVIHVRLAMANMADAEKGGADTGKSREKMLEEYELAVAEAEQASKQSNKITIHFLEGLIREQYAKALDDTSPAGMEQNRRAGVAFAHARDVPFSQVIQEEGQLERERTEKMNAAERAADAFRRSKSWRDAAEAFEVLYERNPGEPKYLRAAAFSWGQLEDFEKAYALLDKALQENPIDAEILLMRVELYTQYGKLSRKWSRAAREVAYVKELQNRLPGLFTPDQIRKFDNIWKEVQPHFHDK